MLLSAQTPSLAQPARVLGVDISYWNCGSSSTGISQANWNTGYTTGLRQFAFIRATRGGTTGLCQTAGTPGNPTQVTLSQRYDDSRFIQNITRATAAGMVAGPYHFARPDVDGNTGTDEADHFIQMAGVFMRPGYLMPMYDQEASSASGTDALVQFALDFSDRIYAVKQIRPCIYINGSYSGTFAGATAARRDALAKPAAYTPSLVGPDYPMLWDAYYTTTLDIQTANPKDGYSGFYGPWDDYGAAQPWSFWQHSSTVSIPGFNAVDSSCDSDVSHGDIEYIRNYLVPAVWWNDSSGDWSTLANWNSGQTVVAPVTPADQGTPYATGPLPSARLPGAAGSGPTSGQYDTVILERPSANIIVTLSTGTYNIRKLYMRETLNITGGSLTVNYNPTYRADDSTTVMHGGPLSAQFSGPVTLSGSASLTVHTLQVDATRTFTLNGGTLTFNTIKLVPNSASPAKLLVNGDVSISSLAGATATIAKGAGSGSFGLIDLGGGSRAWNVANGSAAVDLSVGVPVSNGALAKTGLGTMLLNVANTYSGGTTISAGTLEGGVAGSLPGNVTNNAGTLKLDAATTLASGAILALAGSPAAGAVNLNFSGTQTINALYFGTTQKAAGTWAVSGAAHNNATFAGTGLLNVTTGPATSTAVTLTSGSSPSTYGDSLTFTATVTGNSPAGTVQFKVDGAAAGSPITLVGGSASLVTSTLSVAGSPHQITAYYSGDDNNNPSDSSANPLSQVITPLVTCSLTNALVSMVDNPDGTFTLTFVGTPQADYYVLASPDVAVPMAHWTPVAGSTNTVTNASGLWQFTATNTTPQQFYRGTAVVPCP
jgi:autotransporter-associated beta strand protein